jgi:hypothetical protein
MPGYKCNLLAVSLSFRLVRNLSDAFRKDSRRVSLAGMTKAMAHKGS